MNLLFNGRNRVTSGYRLPERPDHNGLDIVGDDSKDILSPVEGVVRSSTIVTNKSDATWEWGNYVRIDDKNGNRYYFCHMASRAVKAGDGVKIGDKLGVMGNTGYSFGAHTHFEMRKPDGKTRLNPAEFLGIPNKRGTYMNQKNGWGQKGSDWYYYENGQAARGKWVKDKGFWYYLGTDGKMMTGLQKIGGKLYYLNERTRGGLPKGAMLQTDGNGVIQL